MSGAERARAHKARMVEQGLTQINVWVPMAAAPEIMRAAELLRDNPDLRIARLVSTKTGKLRGLK